METCKTSLQAGIYKLRLQVQPGSIGVSVRGVSETLTECEKVDQASEPNLPTKKTGRGKGGSSDTKEG